MSEDGKTKKHVIKSVSESLAQSPKYIETLERIIHQNVRLVNVMNTDIDGAQEVYEWITEKYAQLEEDDD